MFNHVQYSNIPAPVTRFIHPDGVAEFRMTKNVEVHKDGEGNTIIEADEVYFEVTPEEQIPTVEEVEAMFDHYWRIGAKWPVIIPPTTLEDVVNALNDLSEIVLGGI